MSADGSRLAALDREANTICMIDTKSNSVLQEYPLDPMPFGYFTTAQISTDLRWAAQAVPGGIVKIHDLESSQILSLNIGSRMKENIVLSPDGRQLVTGSSMNQLYWWDIQAQTNQALSPQSEQVLFSPDSQTLAVFTQSNEIELLNTSNKTLRLVLKSKKPVGSAATFSPSSKILAIAANPF
jgi:WD40 repeat protein